MQPPGTSRLRLRLRRVAAAAWQVHLHRFPTLRTLLRIWLTGSRAQLSGAGIKLDSQMHNLSAVVGVTGEGLKQIEGFARESGKVDWFQESMLLQFGIQTTFQTSVPLRFGCVNNYSYVCIWYLFSNKA